MRRRSYRPVKAVSLAETRAALGKKLADLRETNYQMDGEEIEWLRQQIIETDRALVLEELARMGREEGYKSDDLGADAWVLG